MPYPDYTTKLVSSDAASYTSHMRKRKCAFCEAPATHSVQCREKKRWQFLCLSQKCWDAYYASVKEEK